MKMNKDKNILTKKRFWFLVVVLMLFLYVLVTSRDQIKDRFLVRELTSTIKNEYGRYFKIDNIEIDEENKYFSITLVEKKSCEPIVYNELRKCIDNNLESNPNQHINGFVTEVLIRDSSHGPTMIVFTNLNYYGNGGIALYDRLSCVNVYGFSGLTFSKISELESFYDIKTLRMVDIVIDDITILENFDELEYISMFKGLDDEAKEYLKLVLPDCKVVTY